MTNLIQDAINMVAVSCEYDDPFDMINKLVKRITELEAAVHDALDFADQYVDVVDGPYGPEANDAMHLVGELKRTLGK